MKGRQFLVDPIDCQPQAIVVGASADERTFRQQDNGRGVHVFTKWITEGRVKQWKHQRNWDEMVASGQHAMELDEPDDPLSGVRMDGTEQRGFKYRVNCDEQGAWTCTCKHFEHNNTECCKHINACVDAVVWEENMLVDDRGLDWRPYTTIFNFGDLERTFLGYTDIVEEVNIVEEVDDPYLPSESQFHQFVSDPMHHFLQAPV